jgi:hypothetical protein
MAMADQLGAALFCRHSGNSTIVVRRPARQAPRVGTKIGISRQIVER